MATKILVVESPGFAPEWPGSELIKIEDISNHIPADGEDAVFVLPASLRDDPNTGALLESGAAITCLLVPENVAAGNTKALAFLAAPRTTGVKNTLAKGSSIYSETFFQAGKVGERLDPCFKFARGKLSPKRAVDIWGTLHAMLFLGISSLPEQGEKGTGERVDVQIGADDGLLAFTVRFDLPEENLASFRTHPLLALPRGAVDFFELRYLQDAKKVELLAMVFRQGEAGGAIEAQTFHAAAAMEKAGEFNYESFGSLKGSENEEKRVIKGGFKKRFSDTIKVAGGAPEPEAVTKVTAEKIIDADNGNFLVSGEVLQAPQKVVVSGSAGLGKKTEKEPVAPAAAASPAGKSDSILESKIQSLEATLKQREELVAKLNKEIEEIKDPSKMGVISGIKDNQVEGLKDNIKRLTTDLQEAEKREKDMLAVLDKAVQLKDEAVKKVKEMDLKLRQSQDGNNSKVVTLERQLEEQKRQNKELSKRLSQAGDKKAA
jgi:hypothetical protein